MLKNIEYLLCDSTKHGDDICGLHDAKTRFFFFYISQCLKMKLEIKK